ncbi:hypothetical protein CLAVI_000004 [Candidatus Clavichlamydia salmonicola]|uniref:hypothetical protein n=1 Tax=Candidatus Clavichlamydia salmonicola TaxID=469812 RepID=UPI001890DA84|nr:hypothetical protein [Candidatus Clavichlamydia salmonicola]MBF5050403.1 hypothetical protein [Candidatus Clavichlamydia salmonicola]
MGLGISIFGRKLPSNHREACVNIRNNLSNVWKVVRVVSAVFLGIAGGALVAGYCECKDQKAVSSTPVPPNVNVVDVCKYAGLACALASGIDFGVSAVKTLLVPSISKQYKYPQQHHAFLMGIIWEYLPKVFAMSFTVVSGALMFRNGCIKSSDLDRLLLSYLVVIFYLIDAVLGMLDLCSFDQIKEMHKRIKHQKMLSPLEEADPEMQGEVLQQDPDPSNEAREVLSTDPHAAPKGDGRNGLLCCCIKGKKPTTEAVELDVMLPPLEEADPEVKEEEIEQEPDPSDAPTEVLKEYPEPVSKVEGSNGQRCCCCIVSCTRA